MSVFSLKVKVISEALSTDAGSGHALQAAQITLPGSDHPAREGPHGPARSPCSWHALQAAICWLTGTGRRPGRARPSHREPPSLPCPGRKPARTAGCTAGYIPPGYLLPVYTVPGTPHLCGAPGTRRGTQTRRGYLPTELPRLPDPPRTPGLCFLKRPGRPALGISRCPVLFSSDVGGKPCFPPPARSRNERSDGVRATPPNTGLVLRVFFRVSVKLEKHVHGDLRSPSRRKDPAGHKCPSLVLK